MRVGIFGKGRLGSAVAALIAREPDLELAWCLGRGEAPTGGVDLALEASAAEAVPARIAWAAEAGADLVIGTTGWDAAVLEAWKASPAAGRNGILVAPNFSLGVAFLRRAALALGRLAALDGESELSIVERHHRGKADVPSGTAKLLAAALAEGCPRYGGWAQGRAEPGRIMVASLRAGREIGWHEIRLEAAAETLLLSHDARSRELFARGALRALRWIRGRPGVHAFDELAAEIVGPLFADSPGGNDAR